MSQKYYKGSEVLCKIYIININDKYKMLIPILFSKSALHFKVSVLNLKTIHVQIAINNYYNTKSQNTT